MGKEDREKQIEEELAALGFKARVVTETGWQTKILARTSLDLKHSVNELNRTSTRLARVNIVLTVVLGIIGAIQIWVMVWGH